jgi:hypothetical protein
MIDPRPLDKGDKTRQPDERPLLDQDDPLLFQGGEDGPASRENPGKFGGRHGDEPPEDPDRLFLPRRQPFRVS